MQTHKILTILTLLIVTFAGCGGTGSDTKEKRSDTPSYTSGDIALWEYLVPNSDTTNNYIRTSGNDVEKYRTVYTREADKVTEISDFSKNEKTIYTKNKNNITILFYTDGTQNGRLELKPTVDIGDIVTIKKSDCKLVQRLDIFSFEGKEFNDVIEIKCGDAPGYYQKGVGEILQQKSLTENGKVVTKVLAK